MSTATAAALTAAKSAVVTSAAAIVTAQATLAAAVETHNANVRKLAIANDNDSPQKSTLMGSRSVNT